MARVFTLAGWWLGFSTAVATFLLIPSEFAWSRINPEKRGLEIAQKAKAAESGFHDFSADLKLTLRDSEGVASSPIQIKIELMEAADGEKISAIADSLSEFKGTIFLSHLHKSASDDQWVYTPGQATKRLKRISGSSKTSPFLGSEFAYEDLGSLPVERFKYRFVKQERCDLGICYQVERTPVDSDSAYSKEVVWWDVKDYRLARIDYYDRDDTFFKTVLFSHYRKFLGRWWRASRMEMNHIESGRNSVIEWSNFRFHIGLTQRDFDPTLILRGR